MKGTWNNKTKRYEGGEVEQKDGITLVEMWAKELGVSAIDLIKNILENNSVERLDKCKTYLDVSLLKQTLV